HDVLIANGAPAESYRDDGNRWIFRNANSGWDLVAKASCAPVLTGGPIVDRVWRRLLDRAGRRPGLPMTRDPDLHLLVDDRRIDAVARYRDWWSFGLRDTPETVRIISRSAAPQELGISRDPRSLGVAVRQIIVRQGTCVRRQTANDPTLEIGFHGFEPEQGIRWTNGDATVPATLFSGLLGSFELVLQLGGSANYVHDGCERNVA
ncbi:MAG TPA: hypothetical protein VGL95_06770, partial [Acetobacteraceae bacterium]